MTTSTVVRELPRLSWTIKAAQAGTSQRSAGAHGLPKSQSRDRPAEIYPRCSARLQVGIMRRKAAS